MFLLLKYYIFVVCVSLNLCKVKHYIIETQDGPDHDEAADVSDHDDIYPAMVPIYNESISGDYSAQTDCDARNCKGKFLSVFQLLRY